MAKQLLFENDARVKLKTGVDSLANAVKVTLGPKAPKWRPQRLQILPM